MIIIIGTTSIKKIESLQKILKKVLKHDSFSVEGCDASSGVSETPWDEQTYLGARNRAVHAKELIRDGDLYVGLESGLIERYGHIFEEAWCAILAKEGKEYFGYSSGLVVPDFVVKKMDELKLEHNAVMKLLEDEGSIYKDTWANYTGEVLSRSVSLDEAIRNALIQTFAGEKSLYKRLK